MVGKLTRDDQISTSVLPQIIDPDYPWGTPNEALKRCNDAKKDIPSDFQGNEATEWGNIMEPVVLAECAKRLGLTEVDFDITKAIDHPTLPFSCSLDGLAGGNGKTFTTDPDAGIYVIGSDSITLDGDGIVEAKCTSVRPDSQPPLWRGPIQVQGQFMCCLDTAWAAIATLYQGNKMHIYLFKPHAATQKIIEDAVIDFDHRLNGADDILWYDIEHHSDPITIYPETDEDQPPLILDASLEDLVKTIVASKEAKKNLDEAIKDATMAIQGHMGNHSIGRIGSYEVRWPMKNYKAQPEKTTAAKPAHSQRQKTISVKELA